MRVGRKGIGGIGGILLVLGALYFGIDPTIFMGTGGMAPRVPMDTQLSPSTQSPSFDVRPNYPSLFSYSLARRASLRTFRAG